jgi:hypothetical protein
MDSKIDSEDLDSAPYTRAGLQVIAQVCSAGGCPTIYRTETGDILVQGYTVDLDGVDLPVGEALVQIPPALIADAVRSLQ